MESLKLKNVRTYIQSGNVVFDSAAKTAATLEKKIAQRVDQQHGFRPHVLLLNRKDLLDAINANPFPNAVSEPKTLHFFFLAEPAANPDVNAIKKAKAATEKYQLTDRVFYLFAPDGIGRSKIAANAEKYLGVATTARNFRTVEKIQTMVSET